MGKVIDREAALEKLHEHIYRTIVEGRASGGILMASDEEILARLPPEHRPFLTPEDLTLAQHQAAQNLGVHFHPYGGTRGEMMLAEVCQMGEEHKQFVQWASGEINRTTTMLDHDQAGQIYDQIMRRGQLIGLSKEDTALVMQGLSAVKQMGVLLAMYRDHPPRERFHLMLKEVVTSNCNRQREQRPRQYFGLDGEVALTPWIRSVGTCFGLQPPEMAAVVDEVRVELHQELQTIDDEQQLSAARFAAAPGIVLLQRELAEVMTARASIRHHQPHALLRLLEQHAPQIMKAAYPRAYQCPARYCSPKLIALPVLGSLFVSAAGFQISNAAHDRFQALVHAVLAQLLSYQVPTYFLDAHLLTDLMATDLPDDLTVRDLEWPMESMLFMLPEGAVETPDGDALMLIITRHEPDRKWTIGGRPNFLHDTLLQTASMVPDTAGLSATLCTDTYANYQWTIAISDNPLSQYQDATRLAEPEFDADGQVMQKAQLETHAFVQGMLARLAVTILLAMNAEPELVEAMVLARPPRPSKEPLPVTAGVWHPNYFGRKYGHSRRQALREEGRSHASPRAHWRRGHFRTVFETLGAIPGLPQVGQRVRWTGDLRLGFVLRGLEGDLAQVHLLSGLEGEEARSLPVENLRCLERHVQWIKRRLIGAAQ